MLFCLFSAEELRTVRVLPVPARPSRETLPICRPLLHGSTPPVDACPAAFRPAARWTFRRVAERRDYPAGTTARHPPRRHGGTVDQVQRVSTARGGATCCAHPESRASLTCGRPRRADAAAARWRWRRDRPLPTVGLMSSSAARPGFSDWTAGRRMAGRETERRPAAALP
jgi:hypothetical protein